MREKETSNASRRKGLLSAALRTIVLVIVGATLFVTASAIAAVRFLNPHQLSVLTEKLVNHELNADVTVGNVELTVRKTYPFVNIDIDSVVVISRAIRALPHEVRDTLPQWADTLAMVRHLHGGINLLSAIHGKIELEQLHIDASQLNLLVVNDEINNFDIVAKGSGKSDTLPRITIVADIPRCRVLWNDLKLEDTSLALEITTSGKSPDDTRITVKSLHTRLDATDFTARGTLSTPVSDPQFALDIRGRLDIGRLSSVLTDHIPGTLTGVVTADAYIEGRSSMLTPAAIHKLRVKGDIAVDDLYYMSADTLSMYYTHHIDAHFGNGKAVGSKHGANRDSIASIVNLDSAVILHSGFDIGIDKLKLGAHTQSPTMFVDTAWVFPSSGVLDVGKLSVLSMHDGGGVVFSRIGGKIAIKPYRGDASLPAIDFDAGIATITGGGKKTNVVGSNCRLTFTADKWHHFDRNDSCDTSGPAKNVHPKIPLSEAYAAVKAARARLPHHPHRVRTAFNAAGQEYIHWGTSRLVRKLFNDWKIDGLFSAGKIKLDAPGFTAGNNSGNLNIKFDNEHAVISDIRYQIGKSDLCLSGTISNLREAFTSPGYTSPLKADLTIKSRHIDVGNILGIHSTDDETTPSHATATTKSAQKWLLPINISAQVHFAADEVVYSDIKLNNLGFTAEIDKGGLNINDLKAFSKAGSVSVSAKYTVPAPGNRDIAFDLKVNRFMIADFLTMVPAVDSIMPVIHSLKGVINADVSAHAMLDNNMDILMPTLNAKVHITGDSLEMHDPKKMHVLAKWLLSGKHDISTINHLSMTADIADSQLTVQPFEFDLNRYRLQLYGHNDIAMNFDYHLKVLRSPLLIPIHFNLNISGNPEKWKIKL